MESNFEYIAGSLEAELAFVKEIEQICKIGRVWYNAMTKAGWNENYASGMGIEMILKLAWGTRSIPEDFGGGQDESGLP
jgi:hypothetical protein